MSLTNQIDWYELNRQYLMLSIELIYGEISYNLNKELNKSDYKASDKVLEQLKDLHNNLQPHSTIEHLTNVFNLSIFEKKVLLACAGVELKSDYANFWAQIHENPHSSHPSFAVLMNFLEGAHWDVTSYHSPLRKFGLIHLSESTTLINRPLKIDESILHFLTCTATLDQKLNFLIKPIENCLILPDSQKALVDRVSSSISRGYQPKNKFVFRSRNANDINAIASNVASQIFVQLYKLDINALVSQNYDIKETIMQWNRTARFFNYGLLIDLFNIAEENSVLQAITIFVEHCESPVFIGVESGRRTDFNEVHVYDVPDITIVEQKKLWKEALHNLYLDSQIDQLVNQFHLSVSEISEIAQNYKQANDHSENELWKLCCKKTQPALDQFAERIEVKASWNDIVLANDIIEMMKEIVNHVKYKTMVYIEGGFAKNTSRGLGISALFYGESGTGKTMAAEVIANELKLNLYRIDLSQVVNKYIGETEKNLKRIFDAAENGTSILLFDEADALFGKRSEVRDSHDRYSNLQVGYLLQRMEQFRGLSILTTNMRNAIDKAFERRIRFMVNFERPDQNQRLLIWKKCFPNTDWVNGVDYEKLAQMNIPGGNIRNIALNAAFSAAAQNDKIGMDHLLRASKNEYKKMDKKLSNSEIRDWDETEY